MIVKHPHKKSFSRRKIIFPLGLVLLIALLVAAYFKFSYLKKNGSEADYFCNAEKIISSGGQNYFAGEGARFSNARTISSEQAKSGEHSSKIDSQNPYGMSLKIPDPQGGYRYNATIWRKGGGSTSGLVVKADADHQDQFYAQQNRGTMEENGWEKISTTLTIPNDVHLKEIIIFPYYFGHTGEAYFDDLSVRIIPLENTAGHDVPKLHLYLDDKALVKISKKRNEAISKGILVSGDDDWVKGKLTYEGDKKTDVKVRLKGDWTDHLKGDYWSYRIKMPSDKSWRRMMTFSLQDPKTRDYLKEWFYHKVLEHEDVLTPRYDFVEFSQNNQSPVYYVYEEHFEKQLVENKKRREGVILKYDEDAMWQKRMRANGDPGGEIAEVSLNAASIVAFRQGKTLGTPHLKSQFEHGRNLLHGFRHRKISVSQVFDVEKLAKFMAITDILDATHAFVWHNQRFYYNPLIKKLEPIGYDGYTGEGFKLYWNLFFGEYKSSPKSNQWNEYYQQIYRDSIFNSYYLPMMIKYSDKDFLENILDSLSEEIIVREANIRAYGVEDYTFDQNAILERAKKIRKAIIPYDEHSVKAYRSGRYTWVTNHHLLPLMIVGSGYTTHPDTSALYPMRLVMSNPYDGVPTMTKIKIPEKHKYIYYQLPGMEKVFFTKILSYGPPEIPEKTGGKQTLRIPLSKDDYHIKGNKIILRPRTYKVSSPFIIPKGKILEIAPSTNIDLISGAYILSYDRVIMEGTKDAPVVITSSDKSSQGVAIILASGKSIIRNVIFSNLNNLREGYWQMSGAVTFYESDVKMENVGISSNGCEDALNIIRSNFDINGLHISDTFGDGFDGDFCKGILRNARFRHTGNDALDFSGSRISVDNIYMENVGDKGISGGEQSTIDVDHTEINNAVIGIASKDLSKVMIHEVKLENCDIGFAAYRKKPEYGGGKIILNNFEQSGVKRLYNKDDESEIRFPK